MANRMYSKLLTQINRLFKEDYLLRSSIPDDILNWIYNCSGIRLEGKVLQIDTVPDMNIFIIKDANVAADFSAKDIILLDNKPCKIIVISKNFLDRTMEDVQMLIFDLYKFILDDLYGEYPEGNLLYSVNKIAPYILTTATMQSFGLTFSYELFNIDNEPDIYDVLLKSRDYNTIELLDNGLILKIMFLDR